MVSKGRVLTSVVEQLVALVQHKHLQVLHWDYLLVSERKDTARCSYNDVRGGQAFKKLDLGIDWLTTVDNLTADIFQEFGEAYDFLFNLVSKLSCVAENDGTCWLGVLNHVLKNGKHEDCSLSHARYCLTEDVGAEHGYWDASLLDV